MINQLPEHRRAVHGRTYGARFNHADYDPIERPPRFGLSVGDAAGAIAVGLALLALLLHGLGALFV